MADIVSQSLFLDPVAPQEITVIIKSLKNDINDELKNISLWLKINELSLNIKNTHFILFQPGKAPDIQIHDQPIDRVEKKSFRICHWFKIIIENHICPSVWKIIEEYWYDYQGKRMLG